MAGNSFDIANIKQPDTLANTITNYWMEWDSAKSKVKDRWQETTQYVYATSTRETTNGLSGGFVEDEDGNPTGWSHSTHHPKLAQIHDNLVANYQSALFPHDDFLTFKGRDNESINLDTRRVVEGYISTKHQINGFRETMYQALQDWVIYGNAFCGVEWIKETVNDGEDGAHTSYVGPSIYRISPYDIVFNPLASDFKHSPKIIRTVKTLGELARDIEEGSGTGYMSSIFEKVLELRGALKHYKEEHIDKGMQLSFDGFGSTSNYLKSGYVELLDFYGDIYDVDGQELLKNQVVTVVDRTWVIRKQALDTWDGRPMIFHVGWRTRRDNLWAMGPLDNLVGMQYAINHLENSRADAFDQLLIPTRVITGDVDDSDVVIGRPGGEYRIPSGEGGVTNLAPDVTILQADNQIIMKLQLMEEYAGSPKEAMGFRTPGEKTAFEVQQLQNAASRIFQSKITYFENHFLEPIVNAELELARKHLNEVDTVQVIGTNGFILFEQVTQDDLKSNGALVPIGARHYARQHQLTANLTSIMQMIYQDPLLLQHFPSKKLARVIADLLEFHDMDLVQVNGRIFEQADMQVVQQAAQDQATQEMNDDEYIAPPPTA